VELEFRYLRDFLAVIESGSLGDAARKLKTSQPTLTRSVKLLERAVGGAVFDRTPHGMRPTALGRALLDHARLIVGDLGHAQRALDDLIEGRRGKIVIGTGPLFGAFILPRAVARFQEAYPGVNVVVVQGKMREIHAAVKAGEIDCSFHSAPASIDPDLGHRVLLRGQSAVLVTRKDNPLAAKRRVSLKEIAGEPWLMPLRPDYFRERIETRFTRAGIEPPKPVIEYTAVVQAPRFLMEHSRLLGAFLGAMIRPEIETKRLVRVNVPELAIKGDSSVVYRRGVPMLPSTARLVEFVQAVCGEQRLR
jgi:DNA-binding transcriptional LysR family regulator